MAAEQNIEEVKDRQRLQRYPILKSISEPQKITGAFGIAFEMRQIWIVVGIVMAPLVAYQVLIRHIYEFSMGQGLSIMLPLLVIAVLLAFVRYDGREFGWWTFKRTVGNLKEKTLLWRSRDPYTLEELRDSVQAAMPAETVYYDMFKYKTGVYSMILKVEPVALSLASVEDKQRTQDQLAGVYDTFDFPLVESSSSVPGNVSQYTENTRELVEAEVLSGGVSPEREDNQPTHNEQCFVEYAAQHISWLEDVVQNYNVYERVGYIVLPYKPNSTKAESMEALQELRSLFRKTLAKPLGKIFPFLKAPSPAYAAADQRQLEKAYAILSERAAVMINAYEPLGIRLSLLEGTEALNVMREQTGGGDLMHISGVDQPAPDEPDVEVFNPVTLADNGGYGYLSDEQRDKVLAAVQASRSQAPPALSIGELTITDKLAPEKIDVKETYLEVNDTYHATFFIHDYPDRVHFGILDRFLKTQGNITTMKYINPISKEAADRTLANKISQLVAAANINASTDKRSEKRRDMAQDSAEEAYDKVMMDEESYFELSMLIHCKSDSLEELKSLTEKVRTGLRSALMRAKLAREEMFEGYISSQLFGTNHLTKRHCTRGILTNALSCLFTFSSFRIEHENGILYGIDKESSSLVILDPRQLNDQHMIVFGKPGMGKSFGIKLMATRKRLRGESVVLIDPEGNTGYDRVAHAIGGEYVVLGVGSPHKLNPLEIRSDYMNLSVLAGAYEGEDEESAYNRARAGAFKGKTQKLVDLVNLMASQDDELATTLPTKVQGKLERIFKETYADKGITEDPDTHSAAPPTMDDFFAKLALYAEGGYKADGTKVERDPDLESLRNDLYQWEFGSLSEIFSGQTNVNLDNKFLVLQISTANEGAGRTPIMFAMLDYLSGRLSNPRETTTCYIDELWSLMKFKLAVALMEVLWRVGRVRNTSMVGITQDIAEFLRSEYAETLIKLSSTKMLLGQNRKTLRYISEYIDLSDEQQRKVAAFHKGDALLCLEEDKQVPIRMVASPWEERLMNTDPEKERMYREQEEAELAGGTYRDPRRALPAGQAALSAPTGGDGSPASSRSRSSEVSNTQKIEAGLRADIMEARGEEPGADEGSASSRTAVSQTAAPEDAAPEDTAPGTVAPEAPTPRTGDAVSAPEASATAVEEPISVTEAPTSPAVSEDGYSTTENGHGATRLGSSHTGAEHERTNNGPIPAGTPASENTDVETAPAENGQPGTELLRLGKSSIPISREGYGTVVAVTGDSSPMVGFNLAGLLAMAARDNTEASRHIKVLLVDADGTLSGEHFAGAEPKPVSELSSGESLKDYTIHEPTSKLSALVYPSDDFSNAKPVIECCREEFDLTLTVIGTFKGRSSYGRTWLVGADAVVATGSSAGEIQQTVSESETLRSTNGTLIAPLGRPKLPEELAEHRRVLRLPSQTNRAMSQSFSEGEFAAAVDEYSAKSFTTLARAVVDVARGEAGEA